MFKVGDKVVCIKNNEHDVDNRVLTIGRVYTITYIDKLFGLHYIGVRHNGFNHLQYDIDNFVSLREYRKKRINNLINIL